MAARVAPQAAPLERRNRGRVEPRLSLPSLPAVLPARRARGMGMLPSSASFLGWLRAGPAGAQQPAEYCHGWVDAGQLPRGFPVPGGLRHAELSPSAAALRAALLAARRPTPGCWSRAAAPTTAASWSTPGITVQEYGPKVGRPARPSGRAAVCADRCARKEACQAFPGLAKGTLESGGGSKEKWVVAFQVRGAVPLQSWIPATRGLRRSAQELKPATGPRDRPVGLHPVTCGEAEALGAHAHFRMAVGAGARLTEFSELVRVLHLRP